MAQRVMEVGLALALVTVMLFGHASAQSSCTTSLVGLVPCLSYITGNSSTPSSSCCTQLASIVQLQPQCLCLVLNGAVGSSLGMTINTTQALALPGACNVKTPPVSQCNATAGGPAASPKATPPSTPSTPSTPSSPDPSTPTPTSPSNPAPETPSTPSSPSTPSLSPSEGGSKTTPSTNGQSSAGNSMKSTQSFVASLLLMAACVSVLASF